MLPEVMQMCKSTLLFMYCIKNLRHVFRPEGYTRPELLRDGMHGTTEYAELALRKAFSELEAKQ